MTTTITHGTKSLLQDHKGYGMGKCPPHVKFLDNWLSSTLTWNTPTHLKRALAANRKVAYYPHFIKQEERPTVQNQVTNQRRTCTQMGTQ